MGTKDFGKAIKAAGKAAAKYGKNFFVIKECGEFYITDGFGLNTAYAGAKIVAEIGPDGEEL